jgi:hypothetical protein
MVAFGSHRPGERILPIANLGESGYGIVPQDGGRRPPPWVFSSQPSVLLWEKFATMIPEIREYTKSVTCPAASDRREAYLAEVVGKAFEVYRRLVERGLGELAYPKPLCLAALACLGHIGFTGDR